MGPATLQSMQTAAVVDRGRRRLDEVRSQGTTAPGRAGIDRQAQPGET